MCKCTYTVCINVHTFDCLFVYVYVCVCIREYDSTLYVGMVHQKMASHSFQLQLMYEIGVIPAKISNIRKRGKRLQFALFWQGSRPL